MNHNSDSVGRAAHRLYSQCHQGILSTLSLEIAGHPFGSVVTFAPDRGGNPVILISDIAEHTHNLRADPRVSLTLTEGGDDIQASGRLTLVGSAVALDAADATDAAARYYGRFPHAREYHRAHAFHFYRLEAQRVRYIGGFGRIHWVEPRQLCLPNPFSDEVEQGMVRHMNADHVDAMRDYCRLFDVDPAAHTPRLSGIDSEGFDLMLGKRLLRIDFEAPVASSAEVRAAMVALARRTPASVERAA